jgi:hypothetical protein
MRSYLNLLFEPRQQLKLEILERLLALDEEKFTLKQLLENSPIKKASTLKLLLQEIVEDFEDNYYRDETCSLDLENQKLICFD